MPRPTWNGRRVTDAIRWVVTRDRGICWLCQHPGANSLDHILIARDYPELEWDRTNWKAAHRTRAGTALGCPTPLCPCPGNVGRGTKPHTAPPTRRW